MGLLRTIVLVVAIAALAKGIWCLASPGSAQKAVAWWLEQSARAAKIVAATLIVLGFVLVGLAVARMDDAIVAAVTIFGTVCFVEGLLYLRPSVLQAVAKPFGPDGPPWMLRATGIVLLAVAILLLTLCVRAA